ncbi:MAG: pyridoxal phosphate-dependent aminotransferase, partial [Oscillospiraceae bacterium]|nr:pyridoxal phosphate-dependent aminotransferase [Oscillospiraceae bacterium]
MLNSQALGLGTAPSAIRELFEYGRRQAAIWGEDKVFDFSLGNPSIPAPEEINETIEALLRDMGSLQLHGYTSGVGAANAREAIAADLNTRFQADATPERLFLTCGAAPALTAVFRALAFPGAELV